MEVVLPSLPVSLELALRFPCKSFFFSARRCDHDGLRDDGDGDVLVDDDD